MAWIGPVVGALGGIFSGLSQKKQAREASLALPQAQSYAPTPQMIEAEKMLSARSKFGMSDAELALANQQMARSRATGERSLFNMGLSRLSQGVSNIYGMDAAMQLNALNAQQKEKAQRAYAGMASQFQGIKDREVTSFNQMLQQSRTALGQASASGSKNILAGIGTFAQGMNTNRLAAAYEKSGDSIVINNNSGGPPPPIRIEEEPRIPKSIDRPEENPSASAYNPGMDPFGMDAFGMNPFGMDAFGGYV